MQPDLNVLEAFAVHEHSHFHMYTFMLTQPRLCVHASVSS